MTTTKLVDSSATTFTSDVISPPRIRDEKGLWQSEIPDGGNAKLALQGRTAPSATWHEIVSEVRADMKSNNTNATPVDLFPEMRAVLTGNDGPVNVKGWLAD